MSAVIGLYRKLSTPFETIIASLVMLIYLNVITSRVEENARFAHISILLNHVSRMLGLSTVRALEDDEPEPSAADKTLLFEKERRGLAWARDREFGNLSSTLKEFAWTAYVRGAVYCVILWKLGETVLN